MAYATQSDIENLYDADTLLAVADVDGDDVVDADKLTATLAGATAEIDTYLRDRYVLPLAAPVDPDITRICVDITLYRLCDGLRETDQIKNRYEAAIRDLRSYASGAKKLNAPVPSSGGTGAVMFDGRAHVFTPDTLSDY